MIYGSHPFFFTIYKIQLTVPKYLQNIPTDIVYINTNMYDSRYSAILKLPHKRQEVHAELAFMNIKQMKTINFCY